MHSSDDRTGKAFLVKNGQVAMSSQSSNPQTLTLFHSLAGHRLKMLNNNNVDDGVENNDNVHDDIFMPKLKHPMAS